MTFDEILTQVLDLLQREKRVSYRALKRRFDLDDDYLEDVKDELIYAKKLAIDEDNRVLVWTGETGETSGSIPMAPPPTQAAVTPQSRPRQAEPPPAEPPLPEVEVLWFLGYPDRAVQQSDQALTFAQGLSHPFSLAFALCLKVQMHQRRRETTMVQELAEMLVTLSTEHGFPFRAAMGNILLGWAMVERDEGQAGIARIEEGIAAFQMTGAKLLSAWWLGLRAEAYGKIGQLEEGLTVLAEALSAVEDTGEHFYEAELQRLKGAFLLQRSADNQREAEACFQHAMTIAQSQGAKAWELRTATSLARLWQQQGKRQQARDLLAPVYYWFTEGFDTADLQEAKALLETLT